MRNHGFFVKAILVALTFFFIGGSARAQEMWAVDPFNPIFRTVDMATGAELSSLPLNLVGFTVTGANGLAVHPVTGELFGIIKVSGVTGRLLVTIDPLTGEATSIGNTGDNFSSIEFDLAGTLYGVTGDGATTPETLFTIDPASGTATSLLALGAGNDGETIAFNPTDGFLYHHSGRDTNAAFEQIDLNALTVTDIPRSGFNFDEVYGMMWDPAAGHFLITNLDQELVSLTVNGVGTLVADGLTYGYNRGLALPPPVRVAHMLDPFSPILRTIDPDTGREISSMELTLPGSTVTGGNGLASHPLTGELFGIIKVSGVTGRLLVTIDPLIGEATSIGNTGDNFASIDFDSAGTLYGVTGDGASTPETLFTIDPADGAATFLLTLGAGSDGETIAFNPADGFLYHHSGRNTNAAFEQIDLNALTVIAIPRSGFNFDEVHGMAWDPTAGHFLITILDQELVSITPAGFATLISSGLTYGWNRGFAFRPGNLDTDLAVLKDDGLASILPGSATTYTITVTNNGPLAALGATVVDLFPSTLTNIIWSCLPSAGASCTANGAGDIGDGVDLGVGANVTYTAAATVDINATGTVDNTASVSPAPGMADSDGTNDSSTDSTDIEIVLADLWAQNSSPSCFYLPSEMVVYTVVVGNDGPEAVSGANVIDILPLEVENVSWTCSGAAGGACTASGSGDIDDTVDLPAGGTVTYTVTATVSAGATGSMVNHVEVIPPPGITDPDITNNTDSHRDALEMPMFCDGFESGDSIEWTETIG